MLEAGETHGNLPGHAPDTGRTLPVNNFQPPGSAASLRRASPCPQVSLCLQTVRQARFVPSWHNQCARMVQFQELACTLDADTAVP